MAITYSAGAGTTITSYLVSQAAVSQTQAAGNNQIVMDALPSSATGYGGNIGTGTNGLGNTYVGRLIIIRKDTATEEIRLCVSQTAGTGSTYILTLNEDLVTPPVATTDNISIPYEPGDIEDGGAGGGISFSSKTGLYVLSNKLTINASSGLMLTSGKGMEQSDEGSAISFTINGRFFIGAPSGSGSVAGAVLTTTNNTDGEPSTNIGTGGRVDIYDSLIWSQLTNQLYYSGSRGSTRSYYTRVKWISLARELHLYNSILKDCSISGVGNTADIVKISSNTEIDTLVLSSVKHIEGNNLGSASSNTFTIKNVLFTQVPNRLYVKSGDTWIVINPTWTVTNYANLTWQGSPTAFVYDARSLDVVVSNVAGGLLANSRINIRDNVTGMWKIAYSNSIGAYSNIFIYSRHFANAETISYGNHALQVASWQYKPYVVALSNSVRFSGTITLLSDPNITSVNIANAIIAGVGVSFNTETNSTSIISYTGSGTLSENTVVTGSPSGAIGLVTEIIEGSSTSGVVHLRDRNSIAFANGDSLSATGWTGTYSNGSVKNYSSYIFANSKSLAATYDYISAGQSNLQLQTLGNAISVWSGANEPQPLLYDGTQFTTVRSGTKGVIVVKKSSGTVGYYTSDSGATYIPPASYDLTLTGIKDYTEIRVYKTSDSSLVAGAEDVGSPTYPSGYQLTSGVSVGGSANNRSFTYTYTYSGDIAIYIQVISLTFENQKITGVTLSNSDTTIPIQQRTDRNYNNP